MYVQLPVTEAVSVSCCRHGAHTSQTCTNDTAVGAALRAWRQYCGNSAAVVTAWEATKPSTTTLASLWGRHAPAQNRQVHSHPHTPVVRVYWHFLPGLSRLICILPGLSDAMPSLCWESTGVPTFVFLETCDAKSWWQVCLHSHSWTHAMPCRDRCRTDQKICSACHNNHYLPWLSCGHLAVRGAS